MRTIVLLVATAVVVGACSGGGGTTTKHDVPVVVEGPPEAWSSVVVTNTSAAKSVPPDARRALAPLHAARALDHPGPLSDYGLDHPRAHIAYTSASGTPPSVDLAIGNANFDRHFVYVKRNGNPTVYLLPVDTLRSALAMVGIEDKPPDD